MKVALVYSSKAGMEATLSGRPDEPKSEEDEPPLPPDMLAECDSDETIAAVGHALQEKHQVVFIESDDKAFGRLKRQRPHLVFNIAERVVGPNRESHIPTICEMLDLPYTGSDPLTLGLCLDKSRAKEILSYHRIPNAPFWIVESASALPAGVRLPAIVKPLFEGSSKGIKNNALVQNLGELYERVEEVIGTYRQPAIVERFLPGREFTVGVLGNDPSYEVLPIVEIDHTQLPAGAAPVYSYEAKWIWDTPDRPLEIFHCPADVPRDLGRQIERTALAAYHVLRCRDWARIDLR
ncbi:MAG TPA: D-alanine--D-alanine ligase, partial [Acidobacteriota bacterium]|nr:D-alanine--D-alanine ligase [Acidobacteriota bacterium]